MKTSLAAFAFLLFSPVAPAQEKLAPPLDPAQLPQKNLGCVTGRARTSSQYDERKFISGQMSRDAVVAKLGEPDCRIILQLQRIGSNYITEMPYIDTYEPGGGDSQTRTRIRYIEGVVSSVEREIVR
jgi:hypothetical protein